MKFVGVFLIGACMTLHANVFSQNMKVTVSMKNASLTRVFEALSTHSDMDFLYNQSLIEMKGRIDLKVQDKPLREVLDELLPPLGLEYVFDDKVVVIREKENSQPQERPQIRGIVRDRQGTPLPGVTVILKGTTLGGATGNDGKFSFQVPQATENIVLVFTSVGMLKKELPYTPGTLLEVVLEEDVAVVDEVVVTGIFTKPKESYTGAVTSISAKDLQRVGNRSLLSSIRNIDPGFNIADNITIGSDPNQLPDITVRGHSSMDVTMQDLQTDSRNRSNLPLFIMDGFEITLSRMMDLDRNIVENITLLKDASATALYGTRGANGVVVITTRKPEAGKLRITYTGNLNIEAPDLRSYNLMNSAEKLAFEKAAGLYQASGMSDQQRLTELYYMRMGEVARGVDTYWLKYPVRTGVGNRHGLRIEGGSEELRYAANVSYDNIAGAMKGSSRNTFNGDILLTYQVKDVIFQNNLMVSFNRSKNSPYGTFSDFSKVNAYWKPYDDEGNLLQNLAVNEYFPGLPLHAMYNTEPNPLWNAVLPSLNESKYTQIQNNFSLEWKVLSDLIFRGRLGVTKQTRRSDRYISSQHTKYINYSADDFSRRGEYIYGTGETTSYEASFSLNYNKSFAEVHQLYAAADYSFAEEKSEDYTIKAEGISNIYSDFLGMATLYEKGGKPEGTEGISRRMGATLNVNYTYDRRYFVDLSGKLEGSSKFGADERTAPFWSAGIGWNIHQEKFMDDNILNVARVRFSYGTSGSQNFTPYQAITTFKDYGNVHYNGWTGIYLMGMGNADLGWQTTYQANLGFDLELFKGRFRLSADIYDKLTDDMLADITLPSSSGFDTYKANIGKVSNKGVEISLNAFVIRNTNSGWIWSVGGSLAHNKNKIKEISNTLEFLNQTLMEQNSVNPSFLYREGESMNTIYAVRSKGIDPSSGKELFIDRNGKQTYTWDAKDKVPCGVAEPKIWGNINTTLQYKNLSFTATFSYRHGGQLYNSTLVQKVENIYPYDNADKRAYYDRWKTPGEHALYKSVTDFSKTEASSRFVVDENTLQCNGLTLQYELDSEWIKRHLHLSFLSVSGYMEDVFRISTVKQERGLNYPFSRKFSLVLSARF